jgi:hypothetical protein
MNPVTAKYESVKNEKVGKTWDVIIKALEIYNIKG